MMPELDISSSSETLAFILEDEPIMPKSGRGERCSPSHGWDRLLNL